MVSTLSTLTQYYRVILIPWPNERLLDLGNAAVVTTIKPIVAALSLIAQAVFFIGYVFLLADLYGLTYIITPAMEEDPSLLAPYIRETIVSYQSVIGIGIVGAIVAVVIYQRKIYSADWFLAGTRVAGWLWLPFVPVGTIIGIVLLGARREAIEFREDGEQP